MSLGLLHIPSCAVQQADWMMSGCCGTVVIKWNWAIGFLHNSWNVPTPSIKSCQLCWTSSLQGMA